MKPKILVIDGNNLTYRAGFTTGPLSYNGKVTGAIFGVLNQLLTVGKKVMPDNVVFCWDSRKSERRKVYPKYKEKRRTVEGPSEEVLNIYKQIGDLRRTILPQIGITNNFLQAGYEADDLIASIVHNHSNEYEFMVVSSDDDLLQLLDYCYIYNPGKKRFITKQDFKEKYGIHPLQWPDVKKIVGCNSDCVPGIYGVGEITAIKFLTGRLPVNHAKYKTIKHDNTELFARNELLVKLPYPGTKNCEIKENEFTIKGFLEVCSELGFSKLKSRKNIDDWHTVFGRRMN